MHLALVDRQLQEVAGIDPPIDFLDGVDARLRELDREEVLRRTVNVADGDILPLRSASSLMPEGVRSTRIQPPCGLAAILTSKPCSRGFSHRSAMPTAASALPVAIASSN